MKEIKIGPHSYLSYDKDKSYWKLKITNKTSVILDVEKGEAVIVLSEMTLLNLHEASTQIQNKKGS